MFSNTFLHAAPYNFFIFRLELKIEPMQTEERKKIAPQKYYVSMNQIKFQYELIFSREKNT